MESGQEDLYQPVLVTIQRTTQYHSLAASVNCSNAADSLQCVWRFHLKLSIPFWAGMVTLEYNSSLILYRKEKWQIERVHVIVCKLLYPASRY